MEVACTQCGQCLCFFLKIVIDNQNVTVAMGPFSVSKQNSKSYLHNTTEKYSLSQRDSEGNGEEKICISYHTRKLIYLIFSVCKSLPLAAHLSSPLSSHTLTAIFPDLSISPLPSFIMPSFIHLTCLQDASPSHYTKTNIRHFSGSHFFETRDDEE